MITHTCSPRDAFDSCDCPDPDLYVDLCDMCGVTLEAGELFLCNACEREQDSTEARDANRAWPTAENQ